MILVCGLFWAPYTRTMQEFRTIILVTIKTSTIQGAKHVVVSLNRRAPI